MRTLYQEHKVNHLDKADALRQAQLALLKGSAKIEDAGDAKRGLTRAGVTPTAGNFKVNPNAPYSHPFYWAPFILMGNWL
jgi:CHAT domain-containing protein